MSRWEIKDAVLSSTLTPTERLVMLVLVLRADTESGQIPPEYSPSLSVLVRETGLSRSTVVTTLHDLTTLGWVGRVRPLVAEQLRGARNVYVLDIPVRSTTDLPPDDARSNTGLGPGPATGLADDEGGPTTGLAALDARSSKLEPSPHAIMRAWLM
ncbi:MAG TPA: helix-turn-helix domain-containing protein [Actinomycetospora sp.]|uniref:helix-turn-helix domain-containing protein n=1 Tax=Actinomycetospora sp. TaxID=1872135 RepID=UPI002F410BFD